jgi:colanic acid biosynthesis glycosyl transferase WcaI
MRLAVHDFGGFAFSEQLASTLASRGHHVLYLHARGFRPNKLGRRPRPTAPTFTTEGIHIGRPARAGLGVRRLSDERKYGTRLAIRIADFQPDVVISANTPLDGQASALGAAHAGGAAFVFWLQDVYSLGIGRIIGRRLPILGRLIGSRFERLERNLLLSSEGVVSISGDFLPILERWGITGQRTTVVHNWAPLDQVRPGSKQNSWSTELGIADVPVFLYSGTLGRKHDPGVLLALAASLPNAMVVVASEGPGADWLRHHSTGVGNLRLLPFQPEERLSDVLASADVLVALLHADAGVFSVPSKVATYMAAARPILAAMPQENLASRTILTTGAGRVVPPWDRSGFLAAAAELLARPDERALAAGAGRSYAEKEFRIGPIADQFEGVLGRAASRMRRPPSAAAGFH